MNSRKTPKPGSKEYNVENTQDLNMPEFHSSTTRREGSELPPVENLDYQHTEEEDEYTERTDRSGDLDLPETSLGNQRDDDEDEQEKLITP